MIDISTISATWPTDENGWRIAPAGLSWVTGGARLKVGDGASIGVYAKIGAYVRIGYDASIGDGAGIGDGASIGDDATDPTDLGATDGYRKCLAYVDGVPWIGAGCRWFTLADALEHWANHKEDRRATCAQMAYAQALVALRVAKGA